MEQELNHEAVARAEPLSAEGAVRKLEVRIAAAEAMVRDYEAAGAERLARDGMGYLADLRERLRAAREAWVLAAGASAP